MNNFYLTLLSDSSLSTFSKNTQRDFKVKLDHSIQIEKDNWEVGLVKSLLPLKQITSQREKKLCDIKIF